MRQTQRKADHMYAHSKKLKLEEYGAFLESVKARCVYAVRNGEALTRDLVADAMYDVINMQVEIADGKTERAKMVRHQIARNVWDSVRK